MSVTVFGYLILIDQFRYIKIQPKTTDPNTRVWGITTEFVGFIPQSLEMRSIVLGWILIYRNWSVSIDFTMLLLRFLLEHILSKQFEVRQKYFVKRRIFNSLLGKPRCFVFNILLQEIPPFLKMISSPYCALLRVCLSFLFCFLYDVTKCEHFATTYMK